MAYLDVTIARALARCDAPEGVRILSGYLGDARAILAEHAHDELIGVSGEDFGKDRLKWLERLECHGARLTPHPWTQRID